MALTDLFIRRPVIAVVVSLVIVIAGVQALKSINVRQYPRSENAAVTVTTVYVGASPELVRGFITSPLERVIAAAEGIDYLESQSSPSTSLIRAHLRIGYDPNKALAEIGSKVEQVRGDLPPEAQVPIINIESTESQFASAYLSFSSTFLQQNEITDYLTRVVQPRLSAIEGVQRADILGARTLAMRVWLDEKKLAAYGVSPSDVRTALAANNALAAVGKAKGALVELNLTANTSLSTVREFQELVVRTDGRSVVRLKDVAEVALGAEDYDTSVSFGGKTAVFIGVFPLPSANALDVTARVRKEMETLKGQLPPQLTGTIAYDSTEYIQSAIRDVEHTLRDTLLIVGLVIFLFLGSLRSAAVPLVAIPVSLIGGVFLMQVFGFTLNLLTLLAIVLSVGLVVDDAIVVVENVERHLREGLKPIDAALKGARELVGPIIAMTLTLAAVYTPIALQGGLTGSLFREFALTLSGAVLISGVVALTLSPVMAAKVLKPGGGERGFAGLVARAFERLKQAYGRALTASFAVRGPIYVVWLVVSAAAVVMFMQSPKELAPVEDQGIVFGVVNTPADSTLERLVPQVAAINQTLMELPESGHLFQVTTPSSGFWGIALKPWDQRERPSRALLPEVQQRVSKVPGVQTFAILPPALPGGGRFPVELVIASTAESEEVLEVAQQLADRAATSGLFAFPPQLDVKIDRPRAEIVIDRELAGQMGLNLATVGADVAAAVGGNYVNRFSVAGRSYKVIPQLERGQRLTPRALEALYVRGPGGSLVSLATIAKVEESVEARSLNRFQQLNSVTLSGVAIRPLDQALGWLETEARGRLPGGYTLDYTGESRQLRVEGNTFLPAFIFAFVLVFLVLAAQFNSFRDPFVILMGSVPLALFGALLTTFLKMPNPNVAFVTDGWTTTLNVYSQIGLVTLVGLVAKNGILIVEFANKLQEQGHGKLEAVHQAALTRLRPVLMTSVATVAGHFPLTLVSGPGAAARNSIGLVLVVGLTVGTLFTLFFVPAIYLLVAREHHAAPAPSPRAEPTAAA
ncbi:MAG: efflux RND transporter permease subunit [Archangiaceae bacterium]|nr:efflux RND transporter permease subunit [Archangiaceae bacterium]